MPKCLGRIFAARDEFCDCWYVQYKSGVTFTARVHTVGGLMAFGLACVYFWMDVILTRITLRQLSSSFVFWSRLICTIFASIVFIFCILTASYWYRMVESLLVRS